MQKFDKMDPFEEYILENRYVSSLCRPSVSGVLRKKADRALVRSLKFFYRGARSLLTYFVELYVGRKQIAHLIKKRGAKNNARALVLGNGPSQGYLSTAILNKFSQNGGDVFVVNYWQLNKSLSGFVPDFIVVSDPATLSFEEKHVYAESKNRSLLVYLEKNKKIKIVCPVLRVSEISALLGGGRVQGFIDSELRGWTSNTSPIAPRGYVSMTLYKALAIASWFGYREIFVLGMDNTYPRNVYSDAENRVLNLEKHAGVEDFVNDQSNIYSCVGDLLVDVSRLFFDAMKFNKAGKIVNLDPYSLTDAFPKKSIDALMS